MASRIKPLLILFFSVLLGSRIAGAETFTVIGTGGVTGVYYPTGSSICKLVNKELKHHGIRCAIESTNGSVYNLNALHKGELDMAIAQSDWLYHAFHGTSKFSDNGPNPDLRTLFSIHPEPFTVVARADAGIKHFEDLKGKRVNIGNPGSGQRGTMEVVMEAYGWTVSDFALVSELKSSEQSKALCDNKIDAMVFTVGHPSASIKEATNTCKTVILNVDGPLIEKLVAENEYYRFATIPGGMYTGNPDDIKTFGVGAIFVSTTSIPNQTIYHVVKSVFDNFQTFTGFHPAFSNLRKKEMINEGLPAPIHEGALRYYREAGLM
ncbi:TAXI family TRAP transporter solute-binding subunit [Sedimenticola sp.]|uniref:TAXI family TRAP transporter solute-binding subunit n=1 Tax=Sedimenticola sp. TaxID=1940285 RepID=UPI003D0DB550